MFRQTSYVNEYISDKTSTFIDNILTDTSDASNSEEENINLLKKSHTKIKNVKTINSQDKLNIISCMSLNDSAAIENTVTFHAKLNCNLYKYVICIYKYTYILTHPQTHSY